MKFVKMIALILSVMCFAESSTYAMLSGKKPEGSRYGSGGGSFCDRSTGEGSDVKFAELTKEIRQVIAEKADLLSTSVGEDIVVALGNTGSGKSTTLNWLSDIGLKPNDLGCGIELVDPKNPKAAAIGTEDKSQTKYPQLMMVNGMKFFDSPGFRDANGVRDELLGAAFIKQILEKAKSVKIMLVVGSDSITSDKGESIKKLLNAVREMLGRDYDYVIQNSSLFIMTKSDFSGEKVGKFLKQYTSEENCPTLYEWIREGKVFPVRKPIEKSEDVYEISSRGKTDILDALGRCKGKKLRDLNMSCFYTPEAKESLTGIFSELFRQKFDEMVQEPAEEDKISSYHQAIDRLEKGDPNSSDYGKSFWERFNNKLFELSEIKLLGPLAQDVFDKTYNEFREVNDRCLQLLISDWKTKLKSLQDRFKVEINMKMNKSAYSQVDSLKKQIEFVGKSIDEAERKKDELDSLNDYKIRDNIISSIESDEEIKVSIVKDEDSNRELFESALKEFRDKGVEQFVNEVRDIKNINKKACEEFIKTQHIKDIAEREREQTKIMQAKQSEMIAKLDAIKKDQLKRDEINQREIDRLNGLLAKKSSDNQQAILTAIKEWEANHKSGPQGGKDAKSSEPTFTTGSKGWDAFLAGAGIVLGTAVKAFLGIA